MELFQSTLPRGSDLSSILKGSKPRNFNPRSLAGATIWLATVLMFPKFQSTLPRGSDLSSILKGSKPRNFNPRSLAGATMELNIRYLAIIISIHAPSRERLKSRLILLSVLAFQSTLPRGSDDFSLPLASRQNTISIHAPSRERQIVRKLLLFKLPFQSTLPRGSDVLTGVRSVDGQ